MIFIRQGKLSLEVERESHASAILDAHVSFDVQQCEFTYFWREINVTVPALGQACTGDLCCYSCW